MIVERLNALAAFFDRVLSRVPWEWVLIGLIAVFALTRTVCDPQPPAEPPDAPEVAMIPLANALAIIEDMANTQIGLWGRIQGLERRQPQRIIITDTVAAPPSAVTPVVVIRDNKLSTPVYEQTPSGGWTVGIVQDVPVAGCDGLRIVGGEVICDTPRLGKFDFLAGAEAHGPRSSFTNPELAGFDAWLGLHWQRHRDSDISFAALYGTDSTFRLRGEWKWSPW